MSECPIVFPEYNGLTKCTWSPSKDPTECPHRHLPIPHRHGKKICDSVLELIGDTPCVRLTRFAKLHGIKCDLIGKCDFFNPGGSLKDRIGYRMLREAYEDKKINSDTTIIEATSGNTGIGLAMSGAVLGNPVIITLPQKMSKEKYNVMSALGAVIHRTPTSAAWNDPDSHIGLAIKIRNSLPNSCILDQYMNPGNTMAHYDWTATEILEQCGEVDMVVVPAGTGGTITGIGRKFKEASPITKVVGVDPHGSILAQPSDLNEEGAGTAYHVEGIGYDFIPTTLDRNVVDQWVKSDDENSFKMVRDLIRTEGLLAGGSSGAALYGALKACKSLPSTARCVVLLPDGVRNYMSKFLDDDWMVDHGFMSSKPSTPVSTTADLASIEGLDLRNAGAVCGSPVEVEGETCVTKVADVMEAMKLEVMVVRWANTIVGVVTHDAIKKVKENEAAPVRTITNYHVIKVDSSALLTDVSQRLSPDLPYVLVTSSTTSVHQAAVTTRERCDAIITKADMKKFALHRQAHDKSV
eukprot:GHVN01010778.1.p1 GENE.GHVN01010778.1~~GHVN01010778.1.p1  ORF type:complete len:523 (-),score=82.75 GHVN01010778.1:514-2082(-)